MSAPARAFLARFARTLAVMLLSVAALLLGWKLVSGTDWAANQPWLAATATTTGWVLAAAVWLRHCGWRRGPVHLVTWAAPALELLPLVWVGWLKPDGLVLWGPVSALFAMALAMAADPMGSKLYWTGMAGDPRRCRHALQGRRAGTAFLRRGVVAQSAPAGSARMST